MSDLDAMIKAATDRGWEHFPFQPPDEDGPPLHRFQRGDQLTGFWTRHLHEDSLAWWTRELDIKDREREMTCAT